MLMDKVVVMAPMGQPPTNAIQDPAKSNVNSDRVDSTDLVADVLVEALVRPNATSCFGEEAGNKVYQRPGLNLYTFVESGFYEWLMRSRMDNQGVLKS